MKSKLNDALAKNENLTVELKAFKSKVLSSSEKLNQASTNFNDAERKDLENTDKILKLEASLKDKGNI